MNLRTFHALLGTVVGMCLTYPAAATVGIVSFQGTHDRDYGSVANGSAISVSLSYDEALPKLFSNGSSVGAWGVTGRSSITFGSATYHFDQLQIDEDADISPGHPAINIFGADSNSSETWRITLQPNDPSLVNFASVPSLSDLSGFSATSFLLSNSSGIQLVSDHMSLGVSPHNLSLEDVVRNAVTEVADGPVITAAFRPNYGLTLQEAANMFGFYGFNWQQRVTHIDGPNVFQAASGEPLNPSFLDPPDGGYTYNAGINAYPFYYDNNNSSYDSGTPTDPGWVNINEHTFDNGKLLDFGDLPSNPCFGPVTSFIAACGFSQSDGYLYFKTELVGVLPGGMASVPLYEFDWRSNFAGFFENVSPYIGTGAVGFLNNGAFLNPTGGTGGVTLLRERMLISEGPEPSTWTFLILGFGGIGASLRLRRDHLLKIQL